MNALFRPFNFVKNLIKMEKRHLFNARVIGILFIIAAVSAIIGLVLYNPLLKEADYLAKGYLHSNQIIFGAVCELLLVCSAVGTGIAFFPYLKKQNEALALGYFCFRMLETVCIMIGIISVLGLLSLSQDYASTLINMDSYAILGRNLQAVHAWTFMLGPNFMLGINTFIYSYLLYRSQLVPQKLGILGMISAVLIFTAAILELFGVIEQISTMGFLLAFPIFLFEMTLAFWLIIKGFKRID